MCPLRSFQFSLCDLYLWLEDDVTLTIIASKDDGEEIEKKDVETN